MKPDWTDAILTPVSNDHFNINLPLLNLILTPHKRTNTYWSWILSKWDTGSKSNDTDWSVLFTYIHLCSSSHTTQGGSTIFKITSRIDRIHAVTRIHPLIMFIRADKDGSRNWGLFAHSWPWPLTNGRTDRWTDRQTDGPYQIYYISASRLIITIMKSMSCTCIDIHKSGFQLWITFWFWLFQDRVITFFWKFMLFKSETKLPRLRLWSSSAFVQWNNCIQYIHQYQEKKY